MTEKLIKSDNAPNDLEIEKKQGVSLKLSPHSKKDFWRIVILVILICTFATACFWLITDVVQVGANALSDGFQSVYENEKENVYGKYWQQAYDQAEKSYHASNRAIISIDSFSEIEKLEVLHATDTEYVITNGADNDNNITAWLEVTGHGIYTVNLEAAEYIVDDERSFIRIRVPYPELSSVGIDEKARPLYFDYGGFFGNNPNVGVDLAMDQIAEGKRMVSNYLSTGYYMDAAKRAAVSTLESLVYRFNPDVENLRVEVEFF